MGFVTRAVTFPGHLWGLRLLCGAGRRVKADGGHIPMVETSLSPSPTLWFWEEATHVPRG